VREASGGHRQPRVASGVHPTDGGYGGGERRVSDFVVTELKPQIDQRLRTSGDRLDTAIIGSSLGRTGLGLRAASGTRTLRPGRRDEPFDVVDWTLIIGWCARPRQPEACAVYVDSGDAGAQRRSPATIGQNTANLAQAYSDVGWINVAAPDRARRFAHRVGLGAPATRRR